MAGHSKWAKIKHAKGVADAKRGKVFSKLAQQITVAAREGGGGLDSNPQLRTLVEKAKSEALPATNIQRAINRGIGVGQDGVTFEECVYEGIGPGGISFILDVTTDNTNRVVSDLRKLFSDFGGSLSEAGSLSWNFDQKGRIEVRCGKMVENEKYGAGDSFVPVDKEDVMMEIMDITGVLDIQDLEGDVLNVITDVKDLHNVKDSIKGLGYVISTYELIRIPKVLKDLPSDEKFNDFMSELEGYSDIQGIWTDTNF